MDLLSGMRTLNQPVMGSIPEIGFRCDDDISYFVAIFVGGLELKEFNNSKNMTPSRSRDIIFQML